MPDASPIRDLESTDELRPDGRHILPMLAAFAALGTLSTTIILPAFPSLAPVHLGLFYAATVFVVFGAGMAAPGLARSTGVHFTIVVGLSLALLGGCLLFLSVHAPSFWSFAAATVVFLAGFGLANPVMTAAALQPFGRQAGFASVLLGFVQMGDAALATGSSTLSPISALATLGCLIVIGSATAALLFAGKKPIEHQWWFPVFAVIDTRMLCLISENRESICSTEASGTMNLVNGRRATRYCV